MVANERSKVQCIGSTVLISSMWMVVWGIIAIKLHSIGNIIVIHRSNSKLCKLDYVTQVP